MDEILIQVINLEVLQRLLARFAHPREVLRPQFSGQEDRGSLDVCVFLERISESVSDLLFIHVTRCAVDVTVPYL